MSAFNTIKTALFMGTLYGVLVGLGSFLGGGHGMLGALIMASVFNLITYFYSDRLVLAMYSAKPISQESHPKIYAMVKELCETADLPMPKIWIIESNNANAFATGRNPEHASIAFTTSIIKLLDADELRAVAAHELSHVKNRDILIGTLAATLAAAIAYCADMIRWSMYWGGNNRKKQEHSWIVVMLALFLRQSSQPSFNSQFLDHENFKQMNRAHTCAMNRWLSLQPLRNYTEVQRWKTQNLMPEHQLHTFSSVIPSKVNLC